MAGFTLNGFGAADSYYLLKSLPGHHCRSCGKADYALMELKMKIRVLYIPTISVGTKYAVVCPKCKNGYYVSEEQKSYILNHDSSCVEVTSSGVIIHRSEDKTKQEEVIVEAHGQERYKAEEKELQEKAPQENDAQPKCKCGAPLPPDSNFCTQCGARVRTVQPQWLAEEKTSVKESEKELIVTPGDKREDMLAGVQFSVAEKAAFVYQTPKICPECGMRSVSGQDICSICGCTLVEK